MLASLLFLTIFVNHSYTLRENEIHVVAMIPYLYTRDKYCFKSAMRAAVDYINADDSILNGYKIVVDYQDSTTLIGFSYVRFYQVVNSAEIRQAMIGPAFSGITKAIASVATAYNLPQVTYAALTELNGELIRTGDNTKSIRLTKKYPFFLRTTPSIVSFNKAKIGLFQHFKWKKVAILYEYSAAQYFTAATGLADQLNEHGIEAVSIQGFSDELLNVGGQLKALKEADARIIVGFFGTPGARRIFCEAYKRGMFGSKYQWVIVHGIPSNWHVDVKFNDLNNCTQTQYLEMADGYITIARLALRRDGGKTIANQTTTAIWEKIRAYKKEEWDHFYIARNKTIPPIPESAFYVESTFAFDAVYTVALGLNKSIPLKGQVKDYKSTERAIQATEDMLSSHFEGATGHLSFDKETEERLGEVLIRQFRRVNSTKGVLNDIGVFSVAKKQVQFYDNQSGVTIFKDGRVIMDGLKTVRIARTYTTTTISIFWTLSSIGLLLSVFFLFINIKYKDVRLIKMSSPNINNGIIAGCILCYITSYIYGLDSRLVHPSRIPIACNAVTLTLPIGFTLSFGSLFSKTWRVYKIFTAAKTMERVAIHDSHLYGIIVGLMAIDVIIFVFWIIFSPFKIVEYDLETVTVGDFSDSYFYHKCSSEYQLAFSVIMYTYKGFLLVFGLFLAWETRNVKVAVLNDSKFIGVAVYIVSVVSAVGVICASALFNTDNFSSGFVVISLCIFCCTTGTLLLIFLPKMKMLFGKNKDVVYGTVHSKSQNKSYKK